MNNSANKKQQQTKVKTTKNSKQKTSEVALLTTSFPASFSSVKPPAVFETLEIQKIQQQHSLGNNFLKAEKIISATLLIVLFGFLSWMLFLHLKKTKGRKSDHKETFFCLPPHQPPMPPCPPSVSSLSSISYPCGGPGPSPGPGTGPSPGPCPAPTPCGCGAGGISCSCNLTFEPCSTPPSFPTPVACKYNVYERFDHVNEELKYAKYNTNVNNYLVRARLFDIESTVDALKDNVEIIPDNADFLTFVPTFYALNFQSLSLLNQTLDVPCSSFEIPIGNFNGNLALGSAPPTGIGTVYRIDILAQSVKDSSNSLTSPVTNETIVTFYANNSNSSPIAKFVVTSSTSSTLKKIYLQEDVTITKLIVSTQYNGLHIEVLRIFGEATF